MPLPSPLALRALYPLQPAEAAFIAAARLTITHLLAGNDPRLLVIVGPCSVHDIASSVEYAEKLQTLAKKTPSLFLVMRTFFEKSRTCGGWKGFLYDPHLDGSCDLAYGLEMTRFLLVELAKMGIATAAELLEPCFAPYVSDLLSWGCIGARTATSQIHRQLASGMPFSLAFKNSVDGNIDHATQGAAVARQPHTYLGIDLQGCLSRIITQGNTGAHIALRGSDSASNCDKTSIAEAIEKLTRAGLPKQLLVDCSHGNSKREPARQATVLKELLDLREASQPSIRGVILESHLYGGSQPLLHPQKLRYGVSITDPCLSWKETEELILEVHSRLSTNISFYSLK